MSTNFNLPKTTPSDASMPTKGVVGFLLVAATGLALGTGVARASDSTMVQPTCGMNDRPLTVLESGFSSLGQLCDEMKLHGFWASWGGD